MSKPITAKRMIAALKTADPQLTVTLDDVYDPRDPTTHQGCAGTIVNPSTNVTIDLNAAWRPRDEHRMAVLNVRFNDPDTQDYGVMVPNTVNFIAEFIAERTVTPLDTTDDHDATESTEK